MKKTMLLLILSVLLQLHFPLSAQQTLIYPNEIEIVLKKSGKNRSQLETFIQYCAGTNNQQKLQAAYFLVKNMDIHYSDIYYWADSLKNRVPFDENHYENFSMAIGALNDLNTKLKLKPVVSKEYDIHHISSKYLIDNLEKAFIAWNTPQSKHLTFDEFCEYLLPYRNVTEKLEDWRDAYIKAFTPINKSSRSLNIIQAANLLNYTLEDTFESTYHYEDRMCPVTYLSPNQMLFRKRGHCQDRVSFALFAFKAQGIPCRIDMVPFHGTSTGRHYWNATVDEKRQTLAFGGSKTPIHKFTLNREPAKVITITYAKQSGALASILPQHEIPAGFLRNYNYRDVTKEYWPVKDIPCRLNQGHSKKVAFLAVLNGLRWEVVYWGKIQNGNVTFPDMGTGVAYLPMIYEKGKLQPAAYPVLLFDNKQTKVLKPQLNNTHTITLAEQDKYLKYRPNKLYTLYYWNNKWVEVAKKSAGEDPVLRFENVPKEALLLMIPEYSKGKERPFYITQSGERLWW